MVQSNLTVLTLLYSLCYVCTSKFRTCPFEAQQPLKVYPARYKLNERFNTPFIAHLRFNVTKPQILFTETPMDHHQSMTGFINHKQQFVLSCGSFEAFVPITYHKVNYVTFAESSTFITDINLDANTIVRSPSILAIYSHELLVVWYKNIFK